MNIKKQSAKRVKDSTTQLYEVLTGKRTASGHDIEAFDSEDQIQIELKDPEGAIVARFYYNYEDGTYALGVEDDPDALLMELSSDSNSHQDIAKEILAV